MTEIVIYGRGGQGAVTAAKILASAALNDGKHASYQPMFAAERQGAPVKAFVRIDEKEFHRYFPIKKADGIIILDRALLGLIKFDTDLKEGSWIIISTSEPGDCELIKQETLKAGIKLSNIWSGDVSVVSSRHNLGAKMVGSTILSVLASPLFDIVTFKSLMDAMAKLTSRKVKENLSAIQEMFELAGGGKNG